MFNIVRTTLFVTIIFVLAPISALAMGGPGGANPPPKLESYAVATPGPGGANPPPQAFGASTTSSFAYTILTTILSELGL